MYVCACEGTANQIFRTDSRFYHLQSSVGFTGSTSPSTINITPMWQTAPSWYLKIRLKQILVFVHLSINPNTKAHCTLVSQPGTGISKTPQDDIAKIFLCLYFAISLCDFISCVVSRMVYFAIWALNIHGPPLLFK